MKRLLVLLIFGGCNQKSETSTITIDSSMENYNHFDKTKHLVPKFDKKKFDTLHSWDLGWELLEKINIATDQEASEIELSGRLAPGQKALYFFWYLDAQVTNGGFIQFYWNGYSKYLPPIKEGLKLIGDSNMLKLVVKADKEYLLYQKEFEKHKKKGDWSPLYDKLKKFDEYDSAYYKLHDQTMKLLEKYARDNSQEFIRLK